MSIVDTEGVVKLYPGIKEKDVKCVSVSIENITSLARRQEKAAAPPQPAAPSDGAPPRFAPRTLLKPFENRKIVHFKSMPGGSASFGGFDTEESWKKFEEDMRRIPAMWCGGPPSS